MKPPTTEYEALLDYIGELQADEQARLLVERDRLEEQAGVCFDDALSIFMGEAYRLFGPPAPGPLYWDTYNRYERVLSSKVVACYVDKWTGNIRTVGRPKEPWPAVRNRRAKGNVLDPDRGLRLLTKIHKSMPRYR